MKIREIPLDRLRQDEAAILRLGTHIDVRGLKDCWLWNGATTTARGHTYGAWAWSGYSWKPHRVVWALENGPIPAGMTIDHLCRTKLCCNPLHLEPVSASENSARMWANPNRLYSLLRPCGHAREFGSATCRKCLVVRVAVSQAKRPEYYREMKRLQKQKERARSR